MTPARSSWGVRVAVALAIGPALAAPRLAAGDEPPGVHQQLEFWLSGGVYRLASSQDLGGLEQLQTMRSGALGTSLALLELRVDVCPVARLCVGGVAGVLPGRVSEEAVLGLSYRGEVVLNLLTGRWVPFVTLTGGGLTVFGPVGVVGTDTDPTGGWGAGLKYLFGRAWRVRLELFHLMTDGQGEATVAVAHNLGFSAGIGFGLLPRPLRRAPPMDADGDGLVRPHDRCPEAAEDPDGFADDDGCPDPDNDGDGVPDYLDVCPRDPGRAPRGCPARR